MVAVTFLCSEAIYFVTCMQKRLGQQHNPFTELPAQAGPSPRCMLLAQQYQIFHNGADATTPEHGYGFNFGSYVCSFIMRYKYKARSSKLDNKGFARSCRACDCLHDNANGAALSADRTLTFNKATAH